MPAFYTTASARTLPRLNAPLQAQAVFRHGQLAISLTVRALTGNGRQIPIDLRN